MLERYEGCSHAAMPRILPNGPDFWIFDLSKFSESILELLEYQKNSKCIRNEPQTQFRNY